jgi:hypothetical protein
MEARFPNHFESLVDVYCESLLKGRTKAEITEILNAKSFSLFASLLPPADEIDTA